MRLNKSQIAEMCLLYQKGSSSIQLANMYGISPTAICGLLHRRGIESRSPNDPIHRKHSLNEKVFDCITEESAYWIGFLMADGSIFQRGPNSVEISIVLQSRDTLHLERFRSFLGSSHALISIPQTKACRFSVRSQYLADVLATYGVVPNKTYTTKAIGLEFDRHFWRGVVDGDGMVSYSNHKARLELVGSQVLLEQFLMFIGKHIPEHRLTLRPHRNIYKVACGNKTASSIVKVLYERCSIALQRKLETANQIL